MKDVERYSGRLKGMPWWRFVPRSRKVGVLTLLSGVLLLVQATVILSGRPSTDTWILEVATGIVASILIIQAVDGLRILGRRDAVADSDHSAN